MKLLIILIIIFPIISSFAINSNKEFKLDYNYIEKNLVLIKGGSCESPYKNVSTEIDYSVYTNTIETKDFFIFNQEVTNELYREFVKLSRNDGVIDGTSLLPDTLVWKSYMAYSEPYEKYYYRHPAYNKFPIVGLTIEQCHFFCQWLTKWYNGCNNRKYKKVKFLVPTIEQWIFAACEGNSRQIYPWHNNYVIQNDGKPMANFLFIDQSAVRRVIDKDDKELNHSKFIVDKNAIYFDGMGYDLTAPSISYKPGLNGLYNMAGNVSEYVSNSNVVKGGSWYFPGFYLNNFIAQPITSKTSVDRGFRFVMEVIEE